MADHYEQAIEAAIRGMSALDQQLAAARDANARLTAQLVASELREKMLKDELLAQAARIDDLEGRLNRWGG